MGAARTCWLRRERWPEEGGEPTLIAAYLAANWHRSVEEAIEDGLNFWRELRFGDVFAPLMARGGSVYALHR